jgi:hypothetical protein
VARHAITLDKMNHFVESNNNQVPTPEMWHTPRVGTTPTLGHPRSTGETPLVEYSYTPIMKLKLWQWEYDFDKEDAKIVIPLILLLLGLSFTAFQKEALWAGAVAYYLLYFFLKPCVLSLKNTFARTWRWMRFRCPYCKSREVFLQGYQGYHSDEQYAFYLCNHCKVGSVEVNGRLIKTTRELE